MLGSPIRLELSCGLKEHEEERVKERRKQRKKGRKKERKKEKKKSGGFFCDLRVLS